MIPVEQQIMAVFDEHGDNTQRGDCMRASVASLFDLALEDVPHFAAADDWWDVWLRWLEARGLRVANVFYAVDENDPSTLIGWPGEVYWLATVYSPRGRARCHTCKGRGKHRNHRPCRGCDATGLVPSLHSVVMLGREIVWDPHPRRDMGHLGFCGGYEFRVIDPARMQYVSEIEDAQRSTS